MPDVVNLFGKQLKIINRVDLMQKEEADVVQDRPPMQESQDKDNDVLSRPAPIPHEPATPPTCKKPHTVNAKPTGQFPRLNPDGHICHVCGVTIAERYALSLDKSIRWGWYCLTCKPYAEPERNQNLPAL